jgi:hypothetical protein
VDVSEYSLVRQRSTLWDVREQQGGIRRQEEVLESLGKEAGQQI